MNNVSDELQSLRRCARDLVALTALGALWSGQEPPGIARILADVLLNTLQLDLVYVRLQGTGGSALIEAAHAEGRPETAARAAEIGAALAPWLSAGPSPAPASIPCPLPDGGTLRFLRLPIGYAGDWGVIAAGTRRPDFPSEIDRLLGSVAANQAAVALQEARLFAREHHIAETLQRSLLLTPPEGAFPGLELTMIYEPAWEEAKVAGDFYDAFALEGGRVALVVGDVTGKGLEAAAYTAEIKFALRAFLREDPDPGAAMTRLNRFVVEGYRLDHPGEERPVYAAGVVAVLHIAAGDVRLCAAGAEPPLIVRAATAVAEETSVTGLLLGADAGAEYEAITVRLGPGDVLVLATDGITEARRGREFFGYEGLTRLAQESLALLALEQMGQAILEGARRFAGGALQDDACILLARRRLP